MSTQIGKVFLSLFVIIHLAIMVIFPNGGSYVGRQLPNWFVNYANQIGFNVSWNFFSPDPAHTMYFEYRIRFSDEDQPDAQGFLPPQKELIVTNPSERRTLYAMRFFLLDTRRIERFFIPYLCRSYEGAERITLTHVLQQLPSLDETRVHPDLKISDLKKEIRQSSDEYRCSYLAGEEGVYQ